MILTSVVLTFVTLAAASQVQPPAPAGSDAVRVHTVVRPDGKLQIWEIVGDPAHDPTVYAIGPGTGVIPPRPIFQPHPRYTPEAMRARIQGNVKLRCVVNTQGVCEDVRVTESLDTVHGLDEEAIRSVQQSRFNPGTFNGTPVKVAIVIELSFNLRDPK